MRIRNPDRYTEYTWPRNYYFYVPETHIMYLYGAVDFLNVLKKGCWGGVCYWYIVKYIMYL